MTARDLEKLLGGYMTGTLTEAENSALMRAALDDQQLFNALADEEAMRDALADPVFRARLRARLAPEAAPPQRSLRWMWWLAPVMAAGLALVFVMSRPGPERPMEMASIMTPESAATAPAPTPNRTAVDAERTQSQQQIAAPPPARPLAAARAPGESEPISRERGPFAGAVPPPSSQPPPPPPPPPMAAPKPVAESVSVSGAAPVVAAEKKSANDESAPTPKSAAPSELRKATAETDALAAAAFDLQVERSINGRFESTELGALRQGDRVRFRVRVPEAGTLVMTSGTTVARSTLAEAGRTYYLPDANGLPPGDAPVQVAIALHRPVEGERANTLFRARQQASDRPAASALGGAAPAAPPPPAPAMRDARREDSKDKAKEEAGKLAAPAAQAASAPPPPARQILLRLEFKPR